MKIEVSHAARPCRGERRSGDAVVFRAGPQGTLLGVVDVLGHGEIAADTADTAQRFLQRADLSSGLQAVLLGLHGELRATRGAAATLCLFRGSTLEASGVGNVNLRSFGMNVGLVLTRGILGARMRDLRVFHCVARRQARLVIFSDGVRPTFDTEEATSGTPQVASERLLARHGHQHDDATVLIADIFVEADHFDRSHFKARDTI